MMIRTFTKSSLLALAFAAAACFPALADGTVKVSLWDKGGMMDMGKMKGFGMGMRAKMNMAMMGIEIDQKTVPAGKVTLDVTNTSKETQHEMLISPIASEDVVLPYNASENRVDEEASGELGEVEELDPGKSGSLTLDLKPGLYVLFCNIPGHFMGGMWTTLTVE